jgi:hypothetical protein
MFSPSGRGLRTAVRTATVAILAAAGWYGYQFPYALPWFPLAPQLPGWVALASYAVCATAARLAWPRGSLAYGPIPTPHGERAGIVARLRAGAIGVQLAALAAVPLATGLTTGMYLAREHWEAGVFGGVLGLIVTLFAAQAGRRIVQRGLTVGMTAAGIRMGGYFMPWDAIDKVRLNSGAVTIAIERPKVVQPPMAGLRARVTLPAGLLRVPAAPLVAAMEFYRRNPAERARLDYPYPDGSPVILP